jgi:hypothetical protein
MSDDSDRAQDAAERLARSLPPPKPRICVRCGFKLPDAIRREQPDALDCGGTCARMKGSL